MEAPEFKPKEIEIDGVSFSVVQRYNREMVEEKLGVKGREFFDSMGYRFQYLLRSRRTKKLFVGSETIDGDLSCYPYAKVKSTQWEVEEKLVTNR